MKKSYIKPELFTTIIQLQSHLLVDSVTVDTTQEVDEFFVKEDYSFRDRSNVWDDDWDDWDD